MPVLCSGGNTGSATVTTSGSNTNTYTWSPAGGNLATASNLATGAYTVLVNNVNLCSITTTVSITEPPKLNATLTSNAVACNGGSTGSATVTESGGTGAYTYTWFPTGGTAASATGIPAGNYTVWIADANACLDTGHVTITEPSPITSSVTSNAVLCNGGSTGAATLTTSGGTGTYTYDWLPAGGIAASATTLPAGTYTVLITDANSCLDIMYVAITEAPPLLATITSKAVLCNGGNTGAATVAASGGTGTYTYAWLPSGGTTSSATGLSKGNYTVIITDANSCKDTSAVSVTEPLALNASITSNSVLCYGGSTGSASVNTNGGTGAYTYAWSPAGGKDSITVGLPAGNYTVIISDANSCKDTASIAIAVPSKLNATLISNTISCNGGNTGSATVTATGGAGIYTYSWSPSGGTDTTATGLIAGNYTVTITDHNLCTYATATNIAEPLPLVVNTTSATTICVAQSTILHAVTSGGTPAYSYSWSPAVSLNVANTASVTATPVSTTIYTLQVTDANNCNAASQTIQIEVRPFITTSLNGDSLICAGTSANIYSSVSGGDGHYIYFWIPTGETTAAIVVSPSVITTYTLLVSDGCHTPADTMKFTVQVNALPIVNFTADDTLGCEAVCTNFKDLSGVQGGTITKWNWTFGDNTNMSAEQNPLHCYTKPGIYTVSLRVTSNKACSETYTHVDMIKVYTLPNSEFTFDPQFANVTDARICFTNQSPSITSWLWNFGDPNDTTGSELQSNCHLYSDTGKYCVTLQVNSIYGCKNTSVNCLTISPDFTFYIPNSFTPNGDGRNDVFSGEGMYIADYEMWIFDRWDNLIYHTTDLSKKWNGTSGNRVVQEGVYVYKVALTESTGIPHQYSGTVTLIR